MKSLREGNLNRKVTLGLGLEGCQHFGALLCFGLNQKEVLLFYRFRISATALIDYNIYRSVMMVWLGLD